MDIDAKSRSMAHIKRSMYLVMAAPYVKAALISFVLGCTMVGQYKSLP